MGKIKEGFVNFGGNLGDYKPMELENFENRIYGLVELEKIWAV